MCAKEERKSETKREARSSTSSRCSFGHLKEMMMKLMLAPSIEDVDCSVAVAVAAVA